MSAVDGRYNVEISMKVTTVDGKEFFDAGLKYSDMGYASVVAVEELLAGAVGDLVEMGKVQAAAAAAAAAG